MIINALLPRLVPNTVREQIIFILSSEFPLTVKEIKQKIKRAANSSVSYQAIHKELIKLEKQGIVKKENKKFALDLKWIKEVDLFSNLLISNYTTQRKHSINKLLELKQDGDSFSFEFNSYHELDIYFLELLDYFNEFFEGEKKILMHYHHNWWPIIYPMREKQILDKLKSPVYGICGSNHKIDQMCCDFENSIGMNIIHSNNKDLHWKFNILGDLVFSYYTDKKIDKELTEFFKKNKDLKLLDSAKLISILMKKGYFRVVVIRDSVFAKNALKELKLFNQ